MIHKHKSKLVFFFLLLTIAVFNDMYAQVITSISDSDLDAAVCSIENYLNNKKQSSKFGTISVNEWDPACHNGYSPKCTMYVLNTYPYEIFREKDPLVRKNRITISISPDNKKIIVVLNWNNSYYAFYTDLLVGDNGYKILNIPYGLHEGD